MAIRAEQGYVVWRFTPDEAREFAEWLADHPGDAGCRDDAAALRAPADRLRPDDCCTCGEPEAIDVMHRKDGPCYHYPDPLTGGRPTTRMDDDE